MSPRWNWDPPPPPLPQASAPLPPEPKGGGHTRLRAGGWGPGGPQFQRLVYSVVCIHMYLRVCILKENVFSF
jgi:hypothetical protein